MKLLLLRDVFTEISTTSRLYIDSEFECYVIEDKTREPGVKIPKLTAIPYGTYEIKLTYSPRFGKNMLEVINVPDFTGVRLHKGNWSIETDGCLLPGTSRSKDMVSGSKDAYDALFPKVCEALKTEKVFIEIRKDDGESDN